VAYDEDVPRSRHSLHARRRRSRSALLAPLLLVALAACGPSFQAIYEGNARFEHCYALEENPQAPMPDKAACWRDWSERYTYGQTRDRIHYATARYVALLEARNIPTDEALMMAAPGETPRKSTITAPTVTNAFAPPPKVLEPTDPPSPSEPRFGGPTGVPLIALDGGVAPLGAPTALPAASCADDCGGAYRGCNGECESDAGTVSTCRSCLKAYRTCMRSCFK
jgi:hypothetical protein